MLSAFLIRVIHPEKLGYEDSQSLADIVIDVARSFDLEVKCATDYHTAGKIDEQVMNAIRNADVVFADANSANENVWYEIGYADSADRDKVICLLKRGRQLPFDRAAHRSIIYSNYHDPSIRDELHQMLRGLLCEQKLLALMHSDAGPEKAVEYLSSGNLRRLGVQWLLELAKDAHKDVTIRVRSLQTLVLLQALTHDLLTELLHPLVKGRLKTVAYEAAATFGGSLPEATWMFDDKELASNEAMRKAYAEAVVRHWLSGRIPHDWMCDSVFVRADSIVRVAIGNAITELYERKSSQDRSKVDDRVDTERHI